MPITLKALSYYEQIVDVERDAEMTKLSLAAFEELVRRFPKGAMRVTDS